jgi:transposase
MQIKGCVKIIYSGVILIADLFPTMVLSAEDCAKAVALVEDGRSQRYVARMLNVSLSTIQRVLERFQATGRNTRRAGSGRKRKTAAIDDRFLVVSTLRNRQLTSVMTQNRLREVRGVNVSKWTVRRRLQESGLKACRPATGPKLLPRHRVARLQFAREHLHWNLAQWSSVLFTDESRFCLNSPDGRVRVWRRTGERFSECTFIPRLSYGGGSVMVWAGISTQARTELAFIDGGSLTAQRYIEEVLANHVVPFAPFIGDNFMLMQDNARPHSAMCVTQYLEEVGINKLNWPACSPDANPIEHVWDMLGRRIRSREVAPTTIAELRAALQEEWQNIPQNVIRHLIDGMSRRMQAIVRARGGNTNY